MTGEPRSPWLARSILGLLLPDRYRDNQLGDLEEEFRARGRRDGVGPNDPVTFIGVPLVLLATALVANLIPALRATRIDPMETLRAD